MQSLYYCVNEREREKECEEFEQEKWYKNEIE
jgi:hypothetical protein